MGFLSWLFGKKSAAPAIPQTARLDGPGVYDFDVVGESNYQDALEAICGGRTGFSQRKIIDATLIYEDDNPHDNQAIRVDIDEETVGYLDRRSARRYRAQLKEGGLAGLTVICPAMIVGGWDRGSGDRGHFGVRLDLPLGDER